MGVLGCCCRPSAPWHRVARSGGVGDRGAGHVGSSWPGESTGCPWEPQEQLAWASHLLALRGAFGARLNRGAPARLGGLPSCARVVRLPKDWFGFVRRACPFLKLLIKSLLVQKEDAGRTLFLPQAGEVTREVGGRGGTRAAGAQGPCRKRHRWGFAICLGPASPGRGKAAEQKCWGGGCVSPRGSSTGRS